MGIVKISDHMHRNLRLASEALSRSINAQAEHWLRIGMLAELHPELNHRDLCQLLVRAKLEGDDQNLVFFSDARPASPSSPRKSGRRPMQ